MLENMRYKFNILVKYMRRCEKENKEDRRKRKRDLGLKRIES